MLSLDLIKQLVKRLISRWHIIALQVGSEDMLLPVGWLCGNRVSVERQGRIWGVGTCVSINEPQSISEATSEEAEPGTPLRMQSADRAYWPYGRLGHLLHHFLWWSWSIEDYRRAFNTDHVMLVTGNAKAYRDEQGLCSLKQEEKIDGTSQRFRESVVKEFNETRISHGLRRRRLHRDILFLLVRWLASIDITIQQSSTTKPKWYRRFQGVEIWHDSTWQRVLQHVRTRTQRWIYETTLKIQSPGNFRTSERFGKIQGVLGWSWIGPGKMD